MKRILFFPLMALMMMACSASRKSADTSVALTPSASDSTEYEIVIIDPQFEKWYLINWSPARDYTDDFYRQHNITAVNAWNDYYRTGRYRGIIESLIEYRPDEDYGIEVNRKLYWYFRYIRENYGIRLV